MPGFSDSPLRSVAFPCRSITGANVSIRLPRSTMSEQAVKAEQPQNSHHQKNILNHKSSDDSSHGWIYQRYSRVMIGPVPNPPTDRSRHHNNSLPQNTHIQPTLPPTAAPRTSFHSTPADKEKRISDEGREPGCKGGSRADRP